MIEEFRLQRKIHKKYVENLLINIILFVGIFPRDPDQTKVW